MIIPTARQNIEKGTIIASAKYMSSIASLINLFDPVLVFLLRTSDLAILHFSTGKVTDLFLGASLN